MEQVGGDEVKEGRLARAMENGAGELSNLRIAIMLWVWWFPAFIFGSLIPFVFAIYPLMLKLVVPAWFWVRRVVLGDNPYDQVRLKRNEAHAMRVLKETTRTRSSDGKIKTVGLATASAAAAAAAAGGNGSVEDPEI